MSDLAKYLVEYWKTKVTAHPDSLEFLKQNLYRSLDMDYVAIFNPSTEAMVPPLNKIGCVGF